MSLTEQEHLQRIVAERMLELIDVRTLWHRSLWQLGTVHVISEVVECTNATWDGTIPSDSAQKHLSARAKIQIMSDEGIGAAQIRETIAAKIGQLGSKKIVPGQQILLKQIEELANRAKRDYLLRWKSHIESGGLSKATIEKTARLVVSHLLDDGFDRRHIHGWIKATLATNRPTILTHLLQEGDSMCRQNDVEYTFAIPVPRRPREVVRKSISKFLLTPEEIEALISEVEAIPKGPYIREHLLRQLKDDSPVIVVKSFIARDPHAATAKLDEWLRKTESRWSIGGRSEPFLFGRAVFDRTSMKLRDRLTQSSHIRVPALDHHGLHAQVLNTQLDNALGLLSSSKSLSSMASVATIWAAVEGLLGHPSAKGVDSAKGLAAIVACSFPRAELEELMSMPLTEDAQAANILDGLDVAQGSDRSRILLEAINSHGSEIFANACDIAAAERVLQVSAEPSATVSRVQEYFADVFHRLYYQRNFIMHAAKFDSVSLQSTIRSAPKLVAAGLDRVVHAQHVRIPVEPLGLAARAQNEISMLGSDGQREIFRLLK